MLLLLGLISFICCNILSQEHIYSCLIGHSIVYIFYKEGLNMNMSTCTHL